MLFVQILIIAFVALVIIRTVLGVKKGAVSLKRSLFWLGFWAIILIISLLPQVTIFLAKFLGINRGTDVAVYFSILFIFFIIFEIIIKLEKIEKNITVIVRNLALKNPENETKK